MRTKNIKRLIFLVLLNALFLIFLVSSPKSILALNAPHFYSSSLRATTSGSDQAPADGKTAVKLTVILKDSAASPLGGDVVALSFGSDVSLSITPATSTLDGSGLTTFDLTSVNVGTYSINVVDKTQNVTLTSLGQVTFYSPFCNDTAPGSAPKLISATPISPTKITLKWEKASDPVTYYLVAYGTSSKVYIYGDPNIGGHDATSYTVGGLIPGKKYYFTLRAGNGCTPGAFSNELSATSQVVATNTPAYTIIPTPHVTPLALPSVKVTNVTPVSSPVATPVSGKKLDFTDPAKDKIILLISSGLGLVAVSLFFYIKRKSK